MGEKYEALVEHTREINNINAAAGLLGWDQQVNMPPGGAMARARQMATLARIGHELLVSDETARLIEDAEREVAGMPYDSDEASLVRVFKQDYAENTRLPSSYVAEFTRVTSEAHEVWAHARANNDFAAFRPSLERIIDLVIQGSEYLGYKDHPYDAALERYERGLTTAQVKEVFDGHKPRLVALIAAIREHSDRVSDAVLHQPFDIDGQRAFAMDVVKAFGFDLARGHQAIAVHPFCSGTSRGDVRITTRFNPEWLNPALFGMMHEAGHAMYEQGYAEHLDGTALAGGTSLGVHESQSRMWENMIGRSRGFWTWAFPKLQAQFPAQLGNVDLDTFYRAINKVAPSYIRVEADEATYNLHIILRFEIETGLITGQIKVADLPEEWNQRFEDMLGIAPTSDRVGVLQDIHWSSGLFGYFPTYALGNLLAAQYYEKAVAAHPNIPDDIPQGKFDTLLTWLRENIHVHGRKFTADELTRKVTGEGINSAPYIAYLERKYSEVYGL
ncbi:MAG: carboxypeptidase M32 [Chloroflexota bacterium]|nr:carboxypeptidase M32 [Chloroflexota bacterium]